MTERVGTPMGRVPANARQPLGECGAASIAIRGSVWIDAAVALAYLLLALVKLRLFRTVPVWPSTGVALAAAFIMGDRAWRGVFLGSLLSSWAVVFATGADP